LESNLSKIQQVIVYLPVVLEPYDGNVQRPVRNTLKEVYTAIENDLLFAKASITNTAKSRATVAAANALLARLYLYQERFPEAATAANAVIGTSAYHLLLITFLQ
jgi:hypothetical protein